MKKTALRASGLALLIIMASGCASTSLDDIKASADRAAADASAADDGSKSGATGDIQYAPEMKC